MPRDTTETIAHPIFHEPVYNETQGGDVPAYLSVHHDSDSQVYKQVDDLLKKDVVAFPRSKIADTDVFSLDLAYGSFGTQVVAAIEKSGQIVFDVIGDSGATNNGDYAHEVTVADNLSDYLNSTEGRDRPSFMYHLGDIVYSFGEAKYYFDQFYSPFRNYAAPIIAIPGNHDSFIVPGTAPEDEPLKVFMRNFCADSPEVTADAKSLHRTAMTQPGVYFTLDAPFIRIIGLFSNGLEDPGVISSQDGKWATVSDFQLDFLRAQLTRIKNDNYQGAVLIATHHPSFSYAPAPSGSGTGGGHGSSTEMLAQIDTICNEVGVYPHAFLAGHAHNMQRYTRTVHFHDRELEVPFIVAGASGHHVNALTRAARGSASEEPERNSDVSYMDPSSVFEGTTLTLDQYDDTDFGYMRAKVTEDTLRFDYYLAGGDDTPYDSVVVGLKSGRIQ